MWLGLQLETCSGTSFVKPGFQEDTKNRRRKWRDISGSFLSNNSWQKYDLFLKPSILLFLRSPILYLFSQSSSQLADLPFHRRTKDQFPIFSISCVYPKITSPLSQKNPKMLLHMEVVESFSKKSPPLDLIVAITKNDTDLSLSFFPLFCRF